MKSCANTLLPPRALVLISATLALAVLSPAQTSGQGSQEKSEPAPPAATAQSSPSATDSATHAKSSAPQADSEGKQSSRILGVIPNYRAVSADAHLPPLSFRGKFKLATEDSFDYSSVLVAGFVAGISQARNSTPEFHQGGAGYARYFWHSFADQAVGNYFTEFILPYATHEDPRYFTLGHGGFIKRTGYAISRLFITRTDSSGETFNFSEIIGNGAGAGISDLYYPQQERTWTKTGQKWATQVGLDGVFNVLKEFWPDIRRKVFKQ